MTRRGVRPVRSKQAATAASRPSRTARRSCSFDVLSFAALETSTLPAVPVEAKLALAETDRTDGEAGRDALARARRRRGFLLPERIARRARAWIARLPRRARPHLESAAGA